MRLVHDWCARGTEEQVALRHAKVANATLPPTSARVGTAFGVLGVLAPTATALPSSSVVASHVYVRQCKNTSVPRW